MVRIRLTRVGRTNRPYFRLGVFDARTRRDGQCIENIGTYDPRAKEGEKKIVVDRQRYQYWVGKGAMPTVAVESLLKHVGVL
jgi:small subunit ribosomal protein S16